MVLPASILFGISIAGITFLLVLKRYEYAHQMTVLGAWRARADVFALEVKRLVMIVEWYLARTPRLVVYLSRQLVRASALGFARLAKVVETRSHELADMVSHKRNFERRETKSQFLKEVSEHSIRNSRDVTSNGAGKNGTTKEDEPVASV